MTKKATCDHASAAPDIHQFQSGVNTGDALIGQLPNGTARPDKSAKLADILGAQQDILHRWALWPSGEEFGISDDAWFHSYEGIQWESQNLRIYINDTFKLKGTLLSSANVPSPYDMTVQVRDTVNANAASRRFMHIKVGR
jgi:hypothetical protein